MRIIGGIGKKRKLISFKGRARPTSDRIKETLFNVLGDIEGMSFLDLFAGTGSVGIEALSR
ncbi:MAG TPA: RsmD family RNA methyltransferase, partial [Candidatus Glassbacteria bacterium]|nr:RsmD family RNA methyltransferase [Candidatus Glassbacteria bacterium]